MAFDFDSSWSKFSRGYKRTKKKCEASASSHSGSSVSGTNTTYSSYERQSQVISGRYVNASKLEKLLDTRFGNDYSVALRYDDFTVSARGQLSEAEISSCY